MANSIRFKRGNKTQLPTLAIGEPALCVDTNEFFVGTPQSNLRIANKVEVDNVNNNLTSLKTWKNVGDGNSQTSNGFDTQNPFDLSGTFIKQNNPSNANTYFPCMVSLSNKITVFYRVGSSHISSDGVIKAIDSADGGLTWSNERTIVSDATYDCRIGSCCLTPSGNIVLTYFLYDVSAKYAYPKYIVSSNGGTSWTVANSLPTPSGYSNGCAMRGNFATLSDGTLLMTMYTTDGNVYIVKSTTNGSSWTFMNYINQAYPMNEVSLCYMANEGKLYMVARQQIYLSTSIPQQDYQNKMLIAESNDLGVTWTNFRELPFYGHAPALFKLNNRMMLAYKNTYYLNNRDGKYSLDMVAIKNGQVDSQVLSINRTDQSDFGYSDMCIYGTNLYWVYHAYNGLNLYISYAPVTNFDTMTSLSHRHKRNNSFATSSSSWRITDDGTIEVYKQHDINYTLAVNEKKIFSLTSDRTFPTRALGIECYINSGNNYSTSADFDYVVVNKRIIDASGNIKVMLWNTGTNPVQIWTVRTITTGM